MQLALQTCHAHFDRNVTPKGCTRVTNNDLPGWTSRNKNDSTIGPLIVRLLEKLFCDACVVKLERKLFQYLYHVQC